MKKLSIALSAMAIAAVALTSCNKGNRNVSAEDKAFGDSIATALGTFAGNNSNQQYIRMRDMRPEMAEKFNKEGFLKGLKAVLDADTTDMAYFQGMQMGMQLINPIMGINNEAGFPIDKETVYKAFKKAYMADSVADMNAAYAEYQALMGALQMRMQQREEAKKAESPEAKANVEAGTAYAEKMVGQGYTKSESGLVYKIENPGEDAKVSADSNVKIHYTGRLVDGTEFDSNANVPAEELRAMNASSFIPGFNEALQLVGKGGKLTAVIPADLAYGVAGAGEHIGPNATLVFDIEVIDVEAPAAE